MSLLHQYFDLFHVIKVIRVLPQFVVIHFYFLCIILILCQAHIFVLIAFQLLLPLSVGMLNELLDMLFLLSCRAASIDGSDGIFLQQVGGNFERPIFGLVYRIWRMICAESDLSCRGPVGSKTSLLGWIVGVNPGPQPIEILGFSTERRLVYVLSLPARALSNAISRRPTSSYSCFNHRCLSSPRSKSLRVDALGSDASTESPSTPDSGEVADSFVGTLLRFRDDVASITCGEALELAARNLPLRRGTLSLSEITPVWANIHIPILAEHRCKDR
mmetsp:Transcript_18496/g.44521  ORF Transcript_18496/g.44521 Transcript_18496/m.44521 type:complete len:274 (+) Transcript_18496:519-1340(+)